MQTAADVARRLADQAEEVCRYYLPNGRRQGCYWHIGDVTGAAGRSLYVRLSGRGAGRWTDAATGEHGDLLDLIALNRGLDMRGALAEARDFLRLPRAPLRTTGRIPPVRSSRVARRLFAAARPIWGSLGEAYLRGRGIPLPADHAALRFHPSCHYTTQGGRETWPAMIAAVTDLCGRITGIHRTWLDPATGGKAPVDQPRRALGRLAGNGVRFGRARDVLAAAEGIETTLALKTVMPGMPMVAALSASHLAALILPAGLRRLYVGLDNDAAGHLALERLRKTAGARGIEVRALVPQAEDFNADLLNLGADRLAQRLAEQLGEEDVARFLGQGDRR